MVSIKEKKTCSITQEETLELPKHSQEIRYTVYSQVDKYCLVVLAASIAFWSSCGSPIYFPALGVLEEYFNISEEMVNISVVVYLVCQGISPSMFGGLADSFGRRPVLLVCLVIFIISSAMIAIIKSYTGLLVLRCIQSSAISPAISIAAGVTGDYADISERGWFVGLTTGVAMLGQAFGALIGAGLVAGFGWRAIFWFLTIGSGIVFLFSSLFLPETKRSIAGNGSIRPTTTYSIAPVTFIPYFRKKWKYDNPDYESLAPKKKIDYLTTFKIVSYPEVALLLLGGAIHYSTWTVLLTCLTSQLTKNYGYSVIKVGLCYLPAGLGGLTGAFTSGRLMDFIYKRQHAAYLQREKQGSRETNFNILKARITVAIPYSLLTDGFVIMVGWCLYKEVHIAAIIVSEFIVCMGSMALIGINTTVLVDLYPNNSSAASSAVNLTRCLCSALFVALLTKMNAKMTIGGTLTLMSVLGILSATALLIPMKYGMKWNVERKLKQQLINNK